MEAVIASGAQGIRQGNEPGSFSRGLSLSHEQEDKLWRQRLFSELEENETKRRRASAFLPLDPPARSVKKGEIRVKINVSGMLFETLESTLARYPDTLLGSLQKRMNYFDMNKKEYFFDRNRVAFDAILYYYQSCGRLLRPSSLDTNTFLKEITFFELGEDVLKKFGGEAEEEVEESARNLPKNRVMRKIWEVMEFPHSSLAAQLVAVWSVGIILLSIVVFCMETLPQFKQPAKSKNKYTPLQGIEVFCITWFTLEYVVRFIAAPRKFAFLRAPLNIIDVLAILPYFVTLGISLKGDNSQNTSMVAFFKILRLIRVFRIFKLSRHYRGLKVLGLTLQASTRELLLLAFFLLMGVVIFSSAVYYAEAAQFGSIPEAFWWSVVTMTTVGYGDKAPVTDWGRLIGGLCAIAGVLSLALPVPVIVSNFSYFYNQEKELTEPPPPGNVAAPTVCAKIRKASTASSNG